MADRLKQGDYTEVAVTRRNQCPSRFESSKVCNRPVGHPGEHADVSPSGLVLGVWGVPNATGAALLTPERKEALERIVEALASIEGAIDDAEWVLRDLHEKFAADELMKSVLVATRVPSFYGENCPVDPDDPEGWEVDLEEYQS